MDKIDDRRVAAPSKIVGVESGNLEAAGVASEDVFVDSSPVETDSGLPSEGSLFPTTPAQAKIWMHNESHPADPCLNVSAQWLLTGKIDVPLIGKAWQAIVDRHEALRTQLIEQNGVVLQQVLPHVRFKVSHVDLRATREELKSALADRFSEEEASKAFDLTAAPLFRITILQLSNDEVRMLLTTHHVVSDCWANLTLVREFGEAYGQLSSSPQIDLPEVVLQFGDYASWHEAWLAAGGAGEAERYWTSKLSDLPNFEVPVDFMPSVATHRGIVFGLPVPNDVVRGAVALAQAKGATLFALGLSTFASILRRWTGHGDIVVTTQIAGRDEVELETVIGPLINTIALRLDLSLTDRFADFLSDTVVTVSEALENREMPFERALDRFERPDSDRRGPLMGVNFQVLNNAFLRDSKAGALSIRGIPSVSPGAKRDLDFYLVEREGAWRAQCEYDPDLFEASTVNNLVRSFIAALAHVAAHPDSDIASVPTFLPVSQSDSPVRPANPERESSVVLRSNVRELSEPRRQFESTEAIGEKLSEIWKDLLHVDHVTPESNFFELGGHSLSAIQLMRRIEAVWGVKLPVTTLFKSPTLRQFAELVPHKEFVVHDWQVVPLQSTGSKTPIVALNNTMVYYNLSQKLGSERPFFCFQAFDPENATELPHRSFEQIAADYVRLIKSALPQGPYILLGHCVAGALAFEVAQQLRRDGDRIPLVVMADTWLPGHRRRLPPVKRTLAAWAYRLHVARHDLTSIWKRKETLLEVLSKYRIARRLGILNFAGARNAGRDDWANRWFLPHLEAARDRYRAQKSGESIVVYCSDEITTSFAGSKLGWDTIGEVWVHICGVPGWHTDMFGSTGLDVIANDLALRLEEADRNIGNR